MGRITENTEKYQGVVIYSMHDVPLVSMIYENKQKIHKFYLLKKF